MSVAIAMLLQPLVAVLFFAFALWLARKLYRRLPEGRLKRILFSPLPGHKPRRWR